MGFLAPLKTMGNTASAESPRKSFRRTHRLSKPKTRKHANTSLLSPNGSSEPVRRLSNNEVLPVRREFAPLPSPMYAPSEVEAGSSITGVSFVDSESHDRLIRPPFRSNSSYDGFGRHGRRGSTGTVASRLAIQPPSRANSMIVDASDQNSYENTQAA